MDTTRGSTSSSSTNSSDTPSLLNPFVIRHGRRYLKDLPYPLPCDLPELQRQNLSTLVTTTAFGRAVGSPHLRNNPPKKVLEVACGSAYWSSCCHEYFSSLGHKDISFTGIDIIPVAADLSKQGMDWRFVQHDLRRTPLPFEDGEFDLVVCKDVGLVIPIGVPSQKGLEEFIRVTSKGGTVEIWDVDSVTRSLLPHPPPAPGQNKEDMQLAVETGTFLISPSTPFTTCQNKYLADAGGWMQEAIDGRKLYTMPCSRMVQMLLEETDSLSDISYRRLAVPLGEMRWERESDGVKRPMKRRDSELTRGKGRLGEDSILTEEQAALRYTALTVVIQLIESMEPLLKEVSGKNQEEWQRWWGWMMDDLLQQKGASGGECLEIGACWGTKR